MQEAITTGNYKKNNKYIKKVEKLLNEYKYFDFLENSMKNLLKHPRLEVQLYVAADLVTLGNISVDIKHTLENLQKNENPFIRTRAGFCLERIEREY